MFYDLAKVTGIPICHEQWFSYLWPNSFATLVTFLESRAFMVSSLALLPSPYSFVLRCKALYNDCVKVYKTEGRNTCIKYCCGITRQYYSVWFGYGNSSTDLSFIWWWENFTPGERTCQSEPWKIKGWLSMTTTVTWHLIQFSSQSRIKFQSFWSKHHTHTSLIQVHWRLGCCPEHR